MNEVEYKQKELNIKLEAYDTVANVIHNVRYGNAELKTACHEIFYIMGFSEAKIHTLKEQIKI